MAVAVPSGRAGAVANFEVTIGSGELIGRGTFDLTPIDSADDGGNAMVTITATVVPEAKESGVNYTIGDAEIEVVDDDESN
ncbi:hypothetical protein [Candidatus Palauibacter sp.]|uniref:hypothetical protein n=1 Tax=Candidatus Palauibacter sp. TaxID=3101350 RepID=UPI003AF2C5C0